MLFIEPGWEDVPGVQRLAIGGNIQHEWRDLIVEETQLLGYADILAPGQGDLV